MMLGVSALRIRRRVVVDNSALARTIGGRIRRARKAAGLTQSQLAGDRYTKAYISALESGISKPSMAALDYLAPRLGTTAADILTDPDKAWSRLEADLALAGGDWERALDAYRGLAEGEQERGTRADLLTAISECLCRLDRTAEAIRPASDAAGLLAALNRTDAQLNAEYWLAIAQHRQDHPNEARSILRSVLDRLRAAPRADPDLTTRVLIGLATAEASQGGTAAALAYLEEARAAAPDDRRRGAFFSTLAIAQREAGDHEGALRAGLQAFALLRSAESAMEAELIVRDLALIHLAAGDHERAQALAEESRAAAAARADERQVAILTDTASVIALAAGDTTQALLLARTAIALAERAAHRKTQLDGLVSEARALARLGRHEEAIASFERASHIAEEAGPASRRREIMSEWAESLAHLGRHDEAYGLVLRALAAR